MIQVAQDQQALLDDRVTLAALDMRDKAHAAGIVFVPWMIQTLRARLIHGLRSRNKGGVSTIVRCSKEKQAKSNGRIYGRIGGRTAALPARERASVAKNFPGAGAPEASWTGCRPI